MRKIEQIAVGATDRERLERLVRGRNTPQKLVWRARIVLLASDGLTAEAIAAAVGKSLLTVRRWRQRYLAKGVDGLLKDATRPSRVKPLSPEKIKQVVHMTLHEKPPNATHWSVRSMAKAVGLSYSSVQRIWHAHELKPHLVDTFKVSRDRNFAAERGSRRTHPRRLAKKLPESSLPAYAISAGRGLLMIEVAATSCARDQPIIPGMKQRALG
ncbi:helix-turn-helix domain-containing protein [Bradyrhizobium sp. STM 3562]|uniref:helix-turn-helix domain-containing protein n=1 Tax=Bradyrhizobium sp. STM 3562 TaxID=578924 RepID=UPI00388FBEE7